MFVTLSKAGWPPSLIEVQAKQVIAIQLWLQFENEETITLIMNYTILKFKIYI